MKRFLFSLIALFGTITNTAAQWQQTNGPYGGNVYAIHQIGRWLLVSSTEVYRSSDSGISWHPAHTGINGLTASSFISLGRYVFAGTYQGVYGSLDSGQTWFEVNLGLDSVPLALNVNSISSNGTQLFVGTNDGVYKSVDSGKNWLKANRGNGGVEILSICCFGTSVFAYGGDSVRVSNDSGTSWKDTAFGYNIRFASNDSSIFAVSQNGLFFLGSDSSSWHPINSAQPLRPYSLACDDSIILIGTQYGVMRSTDNGRSWQSGNSGPDNPLAEVIYIGGKRFFAGSPANNGLSYSSDGVHWSSSTKGIIASRITAVASSPSLLAAATSSSGICITTNDGNTWQQISDTLASATSVGILGNNIFASIPSVGFIESSNQGLTWSVRFLDTLDDRGFISIQDTNIWLSSYKSTFQSSNSGLTWDTIANAGLSYITRMDSVLVAARVSLLLSSTNNGVTWTRSWSGGLAGVQSMAVDGSRILATTGYMGDGPIIGDILMSVDRGQTWITIDSSLQTTFWSSVVCFPGHIFAAAEYGSNAGVYMTADFGQHWRKINDGLADRSVTSLVIHDSMLFAGTNGGGIYRRPLSEIIATSAVSEPQQNTMHLFAYPNPFSTAVTIDSPSDRVINDVRIVNLLGENVGMIYPNDSSNSRITWNASNLPAGIYFALVRTSSGIERIALRHE